MPLSNNSMKTSLAGHGWHMPLIQHPQDTSWDSALTKQCMCSLDLGILEARIYLLLSGFARHCLEDRLGAIYILRFSLCFSVSMLRPELPHVISEPTGSETHLRIWGWKFYFLRSQLTEEKWGKAERRSHMQVYPIQQRSFYHELALLFLKDPLL